MRILLIYPGPLFSTFDVARGYDRGLRAAGHEVATFAYHESLLFYGDALRVYRDKHPDADLPDDAYMTLASERVAVLAADLKTDVALVISGLMFTPRGFELLHKLDVPTAIVLTESPYLDGPQADMAEVAQAAALFTNDLESVEALFETTGVPTAYLPHSYDPAVHHPQAVDAEHQSDVFFHGTLWPERAAMFAGLEALPYRVRISGGAPGGGATAVRNGEMAQWYAGTAIALNHHRTCMGQDGDDVRHIDPRAAWSLGPRAFEIAACGAFQLCDAARPELARVFGDSVATYSDPDDLRAKIDHYMQHPAERRAMAQAARAAVEGCTFQRRVESIIIPFLEEAI